MRHVVIGEYGLQSYKKQGDPPSSEIKYGVQELWTRFEKVNNSIVIKFLYKGKKK